MNHHRNTRLRTEPLSLGRCESVWLFREGEKRSLREDGPVESGAAGYWARFHGHYTITLNPQSDAPSLNRRESAAEGTTGGIQCTCLILSIELLAMASHSDIYNDESHFLFFPAKTEFTISSYRCEKVLVRPVLDEFVRAIECCDITTQGNRPNHHICGFCNIKPLFNFQRDVDAFI